MLLLNRALFSVRARNSAPKQKTYTIGRPKREQTHSTMIQHCNNGKRLLYLVAIGNDWRGRSLLLSPAH